MSFLFEVRQRRTPARRRKRRDPTARELKFLEAVAAGDRRPKGCGPASYYCLLHGWVEPLVVDHAGTLMRARKITVADRFEESELKWRSAGFALTPRGAALLRTLTAAMPAPVADQTATARTAAGQPA